jgi:hypothetical protein
VKRACSELGQYRQAVAGQNLQFLLNLIGRLMEHERELMNRL